MSDITISHLDVQKLELQRGDILVIKLPHGSLSDQNKFAHAAMGEALRRAGIDGVQIVIGMAGDEFTIIRKDAA